MKTLQNNFTTPEQSKRLLELGVPADSADCIVVFWKHPRTDKEEILEIKTLIGASFSELLKNVDDFVVIHGEKSHRNNFIPCWSVGRLIEIFIKCHISKDVCISFDKLLSEVREVKIIEWTIRCIEVAIKLNKLDFSKLEE